MPEMASPLLLEFLAWVAARPRTYAEAMEAWRSTCPRHTVWEDALVEGLIEVASGRTLDCCAVTLTSRGAALLGRPERGARP